jgi:hypothetical protein
MAHSTAGGALRATERIQHEGKTQHAYRYPSGGTVLKGALLLGATGAAVIAHRLLRPAETTPPKPHADPYPRPQLEPPPEARPLARLARSPAPADYRAIVASDGEAEARKLTSPQSELLAQMSNDSTLTTVSSAYATLSRYRETPGSNGVFRWSNKAPKASLRRPVEGHVIVCLDGDCIVLSSQHATSIFTGKHPVFRGERDTGVEPVRPECAAMIFALWEERRRGNGVREAEALTDSNGGWLKKPATCVFSAQGPAGHDPREVHCTYTLADGTEETQRLQSSDVEDDFAVALLKRGVRAVDKVSTMAVGRKLTESEAANETRKFRAIVAKGRTSTNPSTATDLTDLQIANVVSRLKSGDRDWFSWTPREPDATIRMPVQGHIIVCLDGASTVMSSKNALRRLRNSGLNIRPECAAMAVALYTKHSQLNDGAHNVTAVALSDNEGLWLLNPATCTINPRAAGIVTVGADGRPDPRWGIVCTCFLEDGTEEVTLMVRGDFVDLSGKEYDFTPASGRGARWV